MNNQGNMKPVTARCLRCGYEWASKLDRPRCCPRCKSYRWKCKSSDARIEGEVEDRNLCLHARLPRCGLGARKACVCADSAGTDSSGRGGSESYMAAAGLLPGGPSAGQVGQGLSAGVQGAAQGVLGGLYGVPGYSAPAEGQFRVRPLLPTISIARSIPPKVVVGAGRIGRLIYPGAFGQLDPNRETLPDIRLPFGVVSRPPRR